MSPNAEVATFAPPLGRMCHCRIPWINLSEIIIQKNVVFKSTKGCATSKLKEHANEQHTIKLRLMWQHIYICKHKYTPPTTYTKHSQTLRCWVPTAIFGCSSNMVANWELSIVANWNRWYQTHYVTDSPPGRSYSGEIRTKEVPAWKTINLLRGQFSLHKYHLNNSLVCNSCGCCQEWPNLFSALSTHVDNDQ